ncbi:hypothetical protein ACR3K2_30920 [Cryptosporidium serpentis]
MSISKATIFYKFKSEKKFKGLTCDLPALVSHVRAKLRVILHIGEDMEILVSASDSNGKLINSYLSDYDVVNSGTYFNVIRLPKESAKPLYEAANTKAQKKQLPNTKSFNLIGAPTESINSSNGKTADENLNVTLKNDLKNLNNINLSTEVTNYSTSEDAAILSVMQQHGDRFKQNDSQKNEALEQLNNRYYRNRYVNQAGILNTNINYRCDPYKKTVNQIQIQNIYNSVNNPKGNSVNMMGSIDVPEDYICHMCGERGHHIRVCPKVNEGASQKKIRPATGIPRSFLRPINFDEEGRLYSEIYCLPDGTFAVLKDAKQLSSTAFLTRTVEDTIGKHMGKSKKDTGSVRNSLTCPICTRLFRYAVLAPCCGETYCQECIINFIRNHVDTASGVSPNTIRGMCPHCSTVISIADLEPNNPIRTSVNVALGLQSN